MSRLFSSRKAQNLTELALLVSIVALAFFGMEVYFRRGLQAKVKNMADNYMTSDAFGGKNLVGNAEKQALYEIDTHNYVVQQSTTPMSATATVSSQSYEGGGKLETSTQDTYIGTSANPATSESEVVY